MTDLTINGKQHQVDLPPDTPLLYALRDQIGLTGTKFGCGAGLCGACTVHLDGIAVRSCVTPIGDAATAKITTIEGLDPAGRHPVQQAWIKEQVPACGLLPVGPDHAGRGPARPHARSERRRHHQRHERQSLPLHAVCPHPPRHQDGGDRDEGKGRLEPWLMTDLPDKSGGADS